MPSGDISQPKKMRIMLKGKLREKTDLRKRPVSGQSDRQRGAPERRRLVESAEKLSLAVIAQS
ncbi:hypothetical protein [Novosphingobium sp. SG707]|uniref:hypothetical protein n=1 Tax=Novosphingobium sp. SG707 TaxID=2586996 RepID=UPI001444D437|nr:hypothetical protein [Novosphingobium sp. SG707]NKJ00434.1 hypothetical protein [Novosphingobium sp. SG707]